MAFCRTAECKPFVFPAMGSHGGGTAEGQRALLADLGITEGGVGAEIRATMEVIQVAETPEGLPVHLDRHAAAADGILVINRVKAHTDFEGRFESGLAKMMTIGMGKHAQAMAVHQHGAGGLREHMPRIAAAMLRTGRVLGALAIVENAEEGPALLGALLPKLRGRSDLDIDPRPVPMTFTADGRLQSPLRPLPARAAPVSAWRDVG